LYTGGYVQTGVCHFGYLHDFIMISNVKQVVLLHRFPLRERNQLKVRNNNTFGLLQCLQNCNFVRLRLKQFCGFVYRRR